jgi:hypothetical protein
MKDLTPYSGATRSTTWKDSAKFEATMPIAERDAILAGS